MEYAESPRLVGWNPINLDIHFLTGTSENIFEAAMKFSPGSKNTTMSRPSAAFLERKAQRDEVQGLTPGWQYKE